MLNLSGIANILIHNTGKRFTNILLKEVKYWLDVIEGLA